MKIYKNVLTKELLEECREDIRNNLDEFTWSLSSFAWHNSINIGITGVCASYLINDQLSKKLESCLQPYLASYETVEFQIQAWTKNSGIAIHNDACHGFGSTIYLNEEWDVNWGGLFLWKESEEDEIFNAFCPKENTMLINTNQNPHLVTPVSPLCPSLRICIQIWGDVNKYA